MSSQGTNPPRQRSFFRIRHQHSTLDFGSFNGGGTPDAANDVVGKPPSIARAGHLDAGGRIHVDVSTVSGLPAVWVGGEPAEPIPSFRRVAAESTKRGMDIVLSGLALLLLLPLMAFVALAIKLSDPGPALFRQKRMGLNGKAFSIYKFRSMYVNKCSDDGVEQTVAGDSRIMPMGAFLRRTSIDELPQLINVLLGHMSLVGPRPHVDGQLAAGLPYERVVPYYQYRLRMRPGLTGWAQSNGFRGPTDSVSRARGRVDHDVAYIQNFSIPLDILIMLTTLYREFFTGSGF